MVSVIPARDDGCVDIHDLSALVQETKWKSMISVVCDHKGQGSFFCNSVDDFWLVVENERHRRLLGEPISPTHPKETKSKQDFTEENVKKL